MGATRRIGSAPFSPKAIPGLWFWIDASEISGQADGSLLHSWTDLSGSGYTVNDSAYPTHDPTYYSSTPGKTVNGKPAVWFASSGPTLLQATATINKPQPYTFLSVFQCSVANSTTAVWGDPVQAYPLVGTKYSAPNWYYSANEGTAYSAGTPDLNPHQITAFMSPNNGQAIIYVDGVAEPPGTVGSGSNVVGIRVGGGGNTFFDGALCEILIYDGQLTAGQLTQLHNYLKTKWGTP